MSVSMDHPDPTYNAARSLPAVLVRYGLQPVALAAVLWYWMGDPENPLAFTITIGSLQLLLLLLENVIPARPGWVIPAWQQLRNVGLVVLLTLGIGIVAAWYDQLLRVPLGALRQSLGLDVWPHAAPLLAQVLLVFFLSEFIWYWFHRAEHRWQAVWRVSGHGAHHAFKHLGALNFGLQASIVHSNLDLNARGIGWLFTTNRYHIHHHSMVMAESNTNYGCSAIIWDRLFGTFADADTLEAGTGPSEPTLWQKFLMPVREPADTAIAPD